MSISRNETRLAVIGILLLLFTSLIGNIYQLSKYRLFQETLGSVFSNAEKIDCFMVLLCTLLSVGVIGSIVGLALKTERSKNNCLGIIITLLVISIGQVLLGRLILHQPSRTKDHITLQDGLSQLVGQYSRHRVSRPMNKEEMYTTVQRLNTIQQTYKCCQVRRVAHRGLMFPSCFISKNDQRTLNHVRCGRRIYNDYIHTVWITGLANVFIGLFQIQIIVTMFIYQKLFKEEDTGRCQEASHTDVDEEVVEEVEMSELRYVAKN